MDRGEAPPTSSAAIRRLLNDPGTRAGLFSFLLTRLLILFVLLLSSGITFQSAPTPFGNIHESTISLQQVSIPGILRRVTSGSDSGWLMNIAINGYEKQPFDLSAQRTWAYFPLYPLAWRAVAKLTGEFPLTGIAISNLCLLFALIMLFKTATAFGYDEAVAGRAVFYTAAFPVSYFFSLALTESLFLLLTLSCLYAAKRDRWWLAGLLGALASATRFAGVFLLVPLCITYGQSSSADLRSKLRVDALGLLLVPAGLIAFMLYLKQITGNAFAFSDIQVTWGHSAGFFWRPLLTYLKEPSLMSAGWDFRLLNFAAAVTALVCAAILLKRRAWALGLFALISIVVPMSYQPLLQSLARYVMVVFPVFIILGLAGRSLRADQTIRAIFIGLLCLMSALLAARVTIAFS